MHCVTHTQCVPVIRRVTDAPSARAHARFDATRRAVVSPLAREILTSKCERFAYGILVRLRESDHRAAFAAPQARCRMKHARILTNEAFLLLRRQLHHALPAIQVDGGEDLAPGAEVRMVEVGALDCALHLERNTAEIVDRHFLLSYRTTSSLSSLPVAPEPWQRRTATRASAPRRQFPDPPSPARSSSSRRVPMRLRPARTPPARGR